jgi:ubiquitin-protein ligase
VFNLVTVLPGLRSLLAMPEAGDTLPPEIVELYLQEREVFLPSAREWTALYATGDSPTAEMVENVEDGSPGL